MDHSLFDKLFEPPQTLDVDETTLMYSKVMQSGIFSVQSFPLSRHEKIKRSFQNCVNLDSRNLFLPQDKRIEILTPIKRFDAEKRYKLN